MHCLGKSKHRRSKSTRGREPTVAAIANDKIEFILRLALLFSDLGAKNIPKRQPPGRQAKHGQQLEDRQSREEGPIPHAKPKRRAPKGDNEKPECNRTNPSIPKDISVAR